MMLAPYRPTTISSVRPARPRDRTAGEPGGAEQRPDRRRRPEDSEPGGPDVEDRPREHRQQRHRASEQHREQVEQDRAEQDLGPAHEAKSLEHALDVRGLRAVRPSSTSAAGCGCMASTNPDGHHAGSGREQVDERRGDPVQETADRGTDDLSGLRRDRAQRHRVLEQVDADERRRHRPRRRPAERHRDTRADGERQIWPHLGRPRPADEREADAYAGAEPQRGGEDQPARQAVGELPRREREHEQRHELRQPDPAEIERAPVQGVDLPADHHLERLQADPHPEQGQPPQAKIALLERGTESSQDIAVTRDI